MVKREVVLAGSQINSPYVLVAFSGIKFRSHVIQRFKVLEWLLHLSKRFIIVFQEEMSVANHHNLTIIGTNFASLAKVLHCSLEMREPVFRQTTLVENITHAGRNLA